ncbi:Glu/Leu/Phe/Val dehydrogenase dimerization domain-containing protein [Nocardia sp. NPDC004123]
MQTGTGVFGRSEKLSDGRHQQVVFCEDEESGLKAIIAIHSTTMGPALDGTRIYPYASESQALDDVLRLSRDMTYKPAAAGLDLGGVGGGLRVDARRRVRRDHARSATRSPEHGRLQCFRRRRTAAGDYVVVLPHYARCPTNIRSRASALTNAHRGIGLAHTRGAPSRSVGPRRSSRA